MRKAKGMGAKAGSSSQPNLNTLHEVLENLQNQARAQQTTVSLGDLLQNLGSRSYGPLLLIPALIALIPVIGAIPGVSIVTGALIVVVSAQLLFRRTHPWIPQRLLKAKFDRERFLRITERAKRWTQPVDRVVHRRYDQLVQPPATQGLALALIILGLIFFPTALIPWGVTLPALAATLLSLALVSADGILVGIGLALTVASLSLLLLL